MASLPHKISTVCRGTWHAVRHALPSPVLIFRGGIGDDLLLTSVAREWALRHGPTLTIATQAEALFENNYDVKKVIPVTDPFQRMAPILGLQVLRPTYAELVPGSVCRVPPSKHIIALMCESIGLTGKVTLRPYLRLSEEERAWASFAQGAVAIQSTGAASRWPLKNKEWGAERFGAVVAALKGRVRFIQLGSASDPLLADAADYRGTSLRQTAAILSQCDLFVGIVGFLMHLSRAVECPAVIIYGGREKAWQSGYTCNTNLESHETCSPCWQDNHCDYERSCLSSIAVDTAAAAVVEAISRKKAPLNDDTVTI